MTFGGYNWQMLHQQDGRTLIIAEHILELHWYHNAFVDVTWADCELRKYLNTDFYNQFSPDDRSRIVEVKNKNMGMTFTGGDFALPVIMDALLPQ